MHGCRVQGPDRQEMSKVWGRLGIRFPRRALSFTQVILYVISLFDAAKVTLQQMAACPPHGTWLSLTAQGVPFPVAALYKGSMPVYGK